VGHPQIHIKSIGRQHIPPKPMNQHSKLIIFKLVTYNLVYRAVVILNAPLPPLPPLHDDNNIEPKHSTL
jgi:hypothetical protein